MKTIYWTHFTIWNEVYLTIFILFDVNNFVFIFYTSITKRDPKKNIVTVDMNI